MKKATKEMTREFWDSMTTKQFDSYLEERRAIKPYLERFAREGGYQSGVPFEEWCKVEMRNDRLKELGI